MRAVLRMGGGGIYNGFPAASNDTAFPCSAGFGFSAWPMAAMLWHWGERKGFTFTFYTPPTAHLSVLHVTMSGRRMQMSTPVTPGRRGAEVRGSRNP